MFKINKNKIIILGKNGFIASSIISELKLNKFRLKSFSKKELNLLINKDLKKLENVIKKNDILLFCSAVAPVKNLKMFYENIKMSENFLKTKNLKKLAAICYLSSDAVFSDSKQKLIESSIKEPNNLHGLMHLTREKLLKLSHKEVFCIRPTLVYGKNDPHNGYGPNKFLSDAKKRGEIKIFGNGEEIRDHINVKDVARLLVMIIKKKKFEDFNFVTSKEKSFLNIANEIKKKFKDIKITRMKRTVPMPHNGYRVFDNKRLKRLNVKISEIKKYIKNYE